MPNSKRISFKMEEDWQSRLYCLSERGAALLESGRWADCHFVLGNASNQLIFACHKLILSAASPVFEAMFYGELAEKNDPIPILDVQPEAFRALLQYIYTVSVGRRGTTALYHICKLFSSPVGRDKCGHH